MSQIALYLQRSRWVAAAASVVLAACGSSGSGSSGNGGGTASNTSPPAASMPAPAPAPTPSTPWVAIGPAPPAIEAPIAVHAASGTIYVASLGGGVLKSTDWGASFVPRNAGLSSLALSSMVMAPNDPNILYAGSFDGGTFKSSDGGTTWAPTADRSNAPLTMAIDPTNPNVVYVGVNGNGGGGAVRKTTDGGATWSVVSTGIPNAAVFSLSVDPRDPRVLYAGSTGSGAFKSTDAGATWRALTIETTVHSILVDPVDSSRVYAGGNGGGVYVSRDAGASFAAVTVPGDGVVLALARFGRLLYAGTASTGLWVSPDEGTSWFASTITGGTVLSLSADANGGVHAGTGRRGALSAFAGGILFAPIAVPNLQACLCQNVYGVTVSPADPRYLLVATNDGGMIESRDGGTTWGDAGTRGFTARAPRPAAFDPLDPSRIYAGAFTGSGFFRSTDGGATWTRRDFGPATIHTTGVTVDPADRAVYVSTLQSGGVWKSADLGETFQRVDGQVAGGALLNLNGRGIAADPGRAGVVFHAGTTGVWRTLDAGATWTRVSTVSSLSVAVDPTDSRNVYVGTQSAGVLKSIDGGTTFAATNGGLTELRTSRGGKVVMHRANPRVLYVGTEGGGVFRSEDAGASWRAVNGGLGNLTTLSLSIDPGNPSTLYAGTPTGIYKTTSGGL